jgi:uncharacterized protein YPO0396
MSWNNGGNNLTDMYKQSQNFDDLMKDFMVVSNDMPSVKTILIVSFDLCSVY